MLLGAFVLKTLHASSIGELTGLTVTNVAIYLVGLVLIVTEVLGGNLSRKKFPGVGFAIIISVAVILSLIYAQFVGVYRGEMLDNVRNAKSFVFDSALLYGLAFLLIDTREQGQRYLLFLVVVLGMLNFASAIGAQYGIELYSVSETMQNADTLRLSGFTGNPNKTAYLICILVAFQYYFYKFHKARLVRYLMAFLMAGELVVVLQTGSRGGLLTLIVVVLTLAYRLRDMRVIYATIVLTPVLIGLLLVTESTLLESSFNRINTLTFGDSGRITTGRDMIWSALLSDYTESFIGVLFGNGFGAALFMGIRAEPHNIYLKVLVEFGIVGLGFFIYFIFSMFLHITRARLNVDSALRASVLASGYVVVVAWFFTTLVGALDFIWFTIGISMAALLIPRKEASTKQQHAAGSFVGKKQPAS